MNVSCRSKLLTKYSTLLIILALFQHANVTDCGDYEGGLDYIGIRYDRVDKLHTETPVRR